MTVILLLLLLLIQALYRSQSNAAQFRNKVAVIVPHLLTNVSIRRAAINTSIQTRLHQRISSAATPHSLFDFRRSLFTCSSTVRASVASATGGVHAASCRMYMRGGEVLLRPLPPAMPLAM